MKTLICYFSGTGNTKKIVDLYKKAFEENNCDVTLYKIESKKFEYDIKNYDFVGIAYPIHAFNAPEMIVDFAKSLPKQNIKQKYFIIKTSGEPLKLNNISSIKTKKILKKKNMILTNEYHYVMPYNIIFRHSDEMAYKMFETAKKLVPIDCNEIINHIPAKINNFFMGSFLAWIFRIEYWGAKFNGKKYKVNDKCVHCNKCVNSCPTNNIKIENGKFIFGKKCIMCMRCSFMCPTNAIKIGWFEKWKVNGEYNFKKPENEENDKHKNFCKKAYEKYFNVCNEKISKN